jgi:hypothetical protein
MRLARWILTLIATTVFGVGTALAQLSGSHVVGDLGLKSGSQAPPGVYLTYFLYDYDSSKIVGQDGRELSLTNGEIQVFAHAPVFSVVTKKKILGANYGVLIIPPIINLAIEAPRLSLNRGTGYGAGDLYVQPVNLGWQTKRADIVAWYGLYAPRGTYTAGENGNRGLGMWSHELALGSTLYLNEQKTLYASAQGSYEIHSKKRDSDVKVGQVFTVEGGVGTTVKRALNFGMAYYLQWKLTDDTGLGLPALVENRLGKNHNYGLGPEASMVLPLSEDLSKLMVLDFRYLLETGTNLDTKGNILVFSATFKVW